MTAARRSRAFLCVAVTALTGLGLVVYQLRGSAQAQGAVVIPKEGDGYEISRDNSKSQQAPSGYEGRIERSTLTAVGNTPATMGKKVVANFTLSNQIKTCPAADGTAEGEGVFAITVDSTDTQASGTSTGHIDMRAKAKYKGQVNDDAYLDGPVKAEIDYTYTQSSALRAAGGAIATSPGSNVEQHITLQFVVAPNLTMPSIGAFAGGDPTQGHFSEAFTVGTALTYWAGVYYSVALTKWRQGQCVEVSFNPPSNSIQPALGTQATIKAQMKTKSGEVTKAKFLDVHAFAGGSVTPSAGRSDVGSPMIFTYTAGNQKSSNAGFQAGATSRAGIAQGEWHTNLGTGWSGQISCSRITEGDNGGDEQQTWSSYAATSLVFEVKDGAGTVAGHSEQRGMGRNLRPVARGGYIFDNSSSSNAVADGTARLILEVNFNQTRGTYSISPGHEPFPPGKSHYEACDYQSGCREQEQPFYVQDCLPIAGRLEGPLSNPNDLSGSISDIKTGLGRSRKGTQTWNVEWHLGRQGTSK